MNCSAQPLTLRTISGWLFLCVVLAAVVLESGGLDSWDTANRLQVTRWIWTDQPQVSNPEQSWYGVIGRGGEKFAWTGLGQSLWMLPAQFLAANTVPLVVSNADTVRRVEEVVVVYLTFPLTSALAVVVIAHLLSALGYRPELAGLGALAAFWCTSLLPFTNINQENALILLCAATGFWAVLEGTKHSAIWWWVLAGAAAGFGILIRLTTVFDSMALGVFGLALLAGQAHRGLPWIWRHYSPRVLAAGAAWAVFVFVERAYNFYRFGSWFQNYRDVMYEQRPEIFPEGNFLEGLQLLLLPGAGGLWFFDPLVILTLAALIGLWRGLPFAVRACALSLLLMLAAYIVFHAADPWPLGSMTWGSRYTTTPVILLSALAVPMVCGSAGWGERYWRYLVPVFVVMALIVQLLASLFWYNLEEAQREQRLGASSSMIVLRAKNAAALVTCRWAEWGLLPEGDSTRLRTPNYFPFLAAKYISPAAAKALQIAWFGVLAVALVANVRLVFCITGALCAESSKIPVVRA
jgi:hypothetical protein